MPKSLVLISLLTFALAFVTVPQVAQGESANAKFLAGLRDRRLFELAEVYCRERLERPNLAEPSRSELVVELIRTLTLHAAHSPAEERVALFQAARDTAARQLRTPSPRAWLIRMQDALTLLAQGELGRQELQVGALAPSDMEPTRQALRESANLLETLDRELAREIPLRRRQGPRPGELTADELFALAQHVQHQLARGLKNRALLFQAGSSDRLALLTEAVESLQKTLTQGDVALQPVLQLELAECQRLLGRFEEPGPTLSALDRDDAEPGVRLRARAELIRLAIVRGDAKALADQIAQGRTAGDHAAAELDLARLEGLLYLAGRAHEAKDAALGRRLQDEAVAGLQLLVDLHGPYWGRRADQLLVAALPPDAEPLSAALAVHRADALFLSKDFVSAVGAYESAAKRALVAGRAEEAFELRYKAALIEQRRGRHAEAGQRFRRLGCDFPRHPQAAAAHLAAAWHAGQLVPADAKAAALYAIVLREHLTTWPAGATADQTRLWLGRLEEKHGQWTAAIEAYGGVSQSAPPFADALAGLARCWKLRLADLAAAGHSTAEPAREAFQQLQAALVGPKNRLPQQWSDAERAVALALAELSASYLPSQAAQAEPTLQAALDAMPGASSDWQAAARVTLAQAHAVGLANAGRRTAALAVYRELAQQQPDRGDIQQGYAELLLAGTDKESLTAALAQWRTIAGRSQPRTERWYRAKYSIAAAQLALGEKESAADLLKHLLQLLSGGGNRESGNTPWQLRFAELLKQCEP